MKSELDLAWVSSVKLRRTWPSSMGLSPWMSIGVVCVSPATDSWQVWEHIEASSSCLDGQALGSENDGCVRRQ